MDRYAYSYDREDYNGSFATPQEAFDAAVKRLEHLGSAPSTVYVGEVVKADPQAGDHAQSIIDHMSQRAHVDYGSTAARYLKNVTEAQVNELDGAVESVIRGWLEKNRLMPTFVKVRGIREYPVPTPASRISPSSSANREVYDLGVTEMPELG